MLSDFIKGRRVLDYSSGIQKGIQLHRYIDEVTDAHPATAKAKQIFRPYYRLYSAPITDIIFDHFLANDPLYFTEPALLAFTKNVYAALEAQSALLPVRFTNVLYYMQLDNWLYHYRTTQGIEKSLQGLMRRATFISDSAPAHQLFLQHYTELQACYADLFPAVKQMAKARMDALLS